LLWSGLSAQEPGAADTFARFAPSPTVPVGATRRLTDSRDGKVYVVRKLADGRFWMVQDLRFGSCSDSSFTTGVMQRGYVGHCRTNTQPGAGYLYDWAAVSQREPGLCPAGWRVPVIDEYRLADVVFPRVYGCASYECWQSAAVWAGVPTAFCNAGGAPVYHPGKIAHWTVTPVDLEAAYCFMSQPSSPSQGVYVRRDIGMAVRCVK
jgi:uncharacterized protein (TIGR02145 family)